MYFKLANLLVEDNQVFNNCPGMYYRSDGQSLGLASDGRTILLKAGANYDFATYFNAISLQKWIRYCSLDNLVLQLEIEGRAKLVPTYADSFSQRAEPISGLTLEVDSPGQAQEVRVAYPVQDNLTLVSFRLETISDCKILAGGYYSEVAEERIRPVRLLLSTTTYKKENYIKKNIDLVRRHILDSTDAIAAHFKMQVVDNGQSLDAAGLSGGGVAVLPNLNTGGSGGFARGMLEALQDRDFKPSHILLMDDDVVVSPESIKRTFNLLSLVNEDYAASAISGAMLSMETYDDRYEDVGAVRKDGSYGPAKRSLRLTLLRDLIENEELAAKYMPDLRHFYAGWWYCCIPMTEVRAQGLPLPFFIRDDDVEYGLRLNRHPFMTMNGIGIWHEPFYIRFNAVSERYNIARNNLIMQALHPELDEVDYWGDFKGRLQLDLKKLNYANAELLCRGIEDYLAGPEALMRTPVDNFLGVMGRDAEKLVSFDQIKADYPELKISLPALWQESQDGRSRLQRISDYLTWNGHRQPDRKLSDQVVAIPYEAASYLPAKSRLHRRLLAIDNFTDRAVLRTMDKPRFKAILKRYKRDCKLAKGKRLELRERYQAAWPTLISEKFWMDYLKLRTDQA